MHVPTPFNSRLSSFGFSCILIGNLFKYYFYWVGVNKTFTIWNPPEGIFPDDGFNSYFISLSFSLSAEPTTGYFNANAHSQGIYFKFKNRSVIVFLCPHKTLAKSKTPSLTPSTTISGIVKLLMRSTLYLEPYLTSRTTDDFSFPNLLFFLVAKVTTMLTS